MGSTFLYVDEENISRKLKCVICLCPAISPMVHRGCNTVMCEDCATALSQDSTITCPTCRQDCTEESLQPNDLIKKLLDEVPVYCNNQCGWTDERGSLWTHLEQFCEHCACENSDECRWRGMEKNRADHNAECDFMEVSCPDRCGATMERRSVDEHKLECKVSLEKKRQRQAKDIQTQCDSLNPQPGDMVTMMVGGKIFVASKKQLTRYPASILGILFSEKERPLQRDDSGMVYLDTCRVSFGHVLTWLYQGIICVKVGSGEFSLLQVEAARWRLQELSEELEQLTRQAKLKQKKDNPSLHNSHPNTVKKVAPEKKERKELKPVATKPAAAAEGKTPEKPKPKEKGHQQAKAAAKGASKNATATPSKKK